MTENKLPLYLQKYIIKIICNFINKINRNFKTLSSPDINFQRVQDENEVKSLVESLSMVNKSWFETVSNNLSVSVDFITYHHNINKEINKSYNMGGEAEYMKKRLLKPKNKNQLLKDENIKELVLNIEDWIPVSKEFNDLLPIYVDLINEKISNRLINLEKVFIRNSVYSYDYINSIECDNIKISRFGIQEMDECIKLTIQNLCFLLKLTPKVEEYNIQICFDNIIYQLNGGNGNSDNGEEIKSCECSKSIENSNINFNEYWGEILKLFQNHKYLNDLTISHNCSFSLTQEDIDDGFYESVMKNENLTNQFMDQFKLIVQNNKLIREFNLENTSQEPSTIDLIDKFIKQ